MKKITFGEMERNFRKYNEEHHNGENYKEAISGVIVYKQSNFDKPYNEKSRSYRVASCNRRFQAGKISNGYYGYCLDGTDDGVRLDLYNWDIDYCYMD